MNSEEYLFDYETRLVAYYREQSIADDVDHRESLDQLATNYSDLLEQTKFITKVSDRLERKLENANEDLNKRNEELNETLQELVKARVGKKAAVIIYSIAIVLFGLEEFFVEPLIQMVGQGMWFGIITKLSIVLLLKPAEGLLESFMLKANRKAKLRLAL